MPFNKADATVDTARTATTPFAGSTLIDRFAREADVIGVGIAARGALNLPALNDMFFDAALQVTDHQSFRTIAIEDTPASAERFNDYVSGGNNDLSRAMAGAFRPWRSQQFAKFLATLKARSRDVRFVGVDTDASEPDEGFAMGVAELVRRVGRVLYLGGVAHVAAAPVQISGEDSQRQPFGHLLRQRLPDVTYKALAVTVGDVLDEKATHTVPLEAEALFTSSRLGSHWVEPSVAGELLRWFCSPRSMLAVGPVFDDSNLGRHHMVIQPTAFDAIAFLKEAKREMTS